jgi:hypothetical protein
MVAMVRIVAILFLFCGWSLAAAHDSWISRNGLRDPVSGYWCCNHIDCRAEPVREVNGGYQVETGEVVPHERIIWRSQDGVWWRCRNMQTNATRCLIGPPPSM